MLLPNNFILFFNIFEYFTFYGKISKKIFIDKKNINKILINDLEKVFLKIDIEESEYKILKNILDFKNSLNGIVIEFHDIYNHMDNIKNFINNIDMDLVHIHPNNFKINNPDIIEITFEKNPKVIREEIILPNVLDSKNNPKNDDINIEFIQ